MNSDDEDFENNIRDSFMFSGSAYRKMSRSQHDLGQSEYSNYSSEIDSAMADDKYKYVEIESPTFTNILEEDDKKQVSIRVINIENDEDDNKRTELKCKYKQYE